MGRLDDLLGDSFQLVVVFIVAFPLQGDDGLDLPDFVLDFIDPLIEVNELIIFCPFLLAVVAVVL